MDKSIPLLLSAGNGPAECRLAVAYLTQLVESQGLSCGLNVDKTVQADKHGYRSALLLLEGPGAEGFAAQWVGTIQWKWQSRLRPAHKRKNWFVGVFRLPVLKNEMPQLRDKDLEFKTMRAGGPGGQHQNTTCSAVRLTHTQSGLSVVVRDQRSQHQNKAVALRRLTSLLVQQQELEKSQGRQDARIHHHQLERGNPVRVFVGQDFKEQRT